MFSVLACDDAATSTSGAGGDAASTGASMSTSMSNGSSGSMSTSASTGTGGQGPIDAGWTGACPATLADRIRVTDLSATLGTRATATAGAIEPMPDGGSRLAAISNATVTLARLDAKETVVGHGTTEGLSIAGLVPHADGVTLLTHRPPDRMELVRLHDDGSVVFDTVVVGDNTHMTEGQKWISSDPHEGRLRFDGTKYAAYFGHNQNWGAQGVHQGDILRTFDANGVQVSSAWEWGCSHSFSVRMIARPGGVLLPLCLSDAYPSPGAVLDAKVTVLGGQTYPGGMAETDDGALVAYSHQEGVGGFDLGIARVHDDLTVDAPKTIVQSTDKAEMTAHIARYGKNYLVSWVAVQGASTFTPFSHFGPTTFAVIDIDGNIVSGPEVVDIGTYFMDDFVSLANGDVGFLTHAAAVSSTKPLQVARVRLCE